MNTDSMSLSTLTTSLSDLPRQAMDFVSNPRMIPQKTFNIVTNPVSLGTLLLSLFVLSYLGAPKFLRELPNQLSDFLRHPLYKLGVLGLIAYYGRSRPLMALIAGAGVMLALNSLERGDSVPEEELLGEEEEDGSCTMQESHMQESHMPEECHMPEEETVEIRDDVEHQDACPGGDESYTDSPIKYEQDFNNVCYNDETDPVYSYAYHTNNQSGQENPITRNSNVTFLD
jgi:hypothetical protein